MKTVSIVSLLCEASSNLLNVIDLLAKHEAKKYRDYSIFPACELVRNIYRELPEKLRKNELLEENKLYPHLHEYDIEEPVEGGPKKGTDWVTLRELAREYHSFAHKLSSDIDDVMRLYDLSC